MADDYGLTLQKALVAALKADAGCQGLVGSRVYDQPPQKVSFPFLRLGGLEERPVRTDGKKAASLTFSIEAHSRPKSGRVEATKCLNAVRAALDEQPLNVTGYDLVRLQWITQTVDRDDDGKTYVGIAAFICVLDG